MSVLPYLIYNLETLYLFVENYRAVITVWAVVGSLNAAAGLTRNFDNASPITSIIARFPLTLLHSALFALAFAISNQHLPSAIIEDTGSKPWRPIPAGRISPSNARILSYAFGLANLLLAFFLGREVFGAMVAQIALSLAYNDLGLSERGFWIRDLVNAGNMTSWLVASSLVAAGPSARLSGEQAARWFGVLGLITYTTLSVVDFHDLPGDLACGRVTLPIWLGEEKARWFVSSLVLAWSVLAPRLWCTDGIRRGGLALLIGGYIVRILLGLGGRGKRRNDAALRHWWYIWYGGICLVPLLGGCV